MFIKLQEKLVKKFSPDVFENIYYYQEESRKWEYRFYKLENEIELYRKVNSELEKILDREKLCVCKLSFDKDKNPVIMAITNYPTTFMGDEIIMIRIISPISEKVHELLLDARIRYYDFKLTIENIEGGWNKGDGTLAMREIIRLAKQKGVKKIVGSLCNGDLQDNQDRLTYFYEKFGFFVNISKKNESFMEGEIYLEIAD